MIEIGPNAASSDDGDDHCHSHNVVGTCVWLHTYIICMIHFTWHALWRQSGTLGPTEPFSGAASYSAYRKSCRPYMRALLVQQKLCLVTLETPSQRAPAMLPGIWYCTWWIRPYMVVPRPSTRVPGTQHFCLHCYFCVWWHVVVMVVVVVVDDVFAVIIILLLLLLLL